MVRHRPARAIAALVALSVGGALSTAEAQTTQRGTLRPNDPPPPRMVVVNFRAADKGAGVAAADAVRERMMREFTIRELWVITKKDINSNLAQSGYPTDEALTVNDAQQLAKILGAETYVDGIITRQGDQYKVDARLALARNADLAQPLPSQLVAKPQDAAKAIVEHVEAARKQVDDEYACYTAAAQQKYDEARAAARKGLVEYPQGTLVRTCILNVMYAQKAPADSMLAVAQELLAIDPRSRTALRFAYQAQKDLGQNDAAINTLFRLLAADPGNAQIQTAVVNELAQSRRFELADSVITAALAENPGDTDLMRTAFPVYFAAERWKKAAEVGEQVAQVDTAFANAAFFGRLAAAYASDSQPQKAAEAIARGTAKFPNDVSLLVDAADMYRRAGQLQQAIDALNRALATDPKAPRANLTLIQIYGDMNQPDTAIAVARRSVAAGDSAQLAAGLLAQIGQRFYRQGNQTKDRADYVTAVRYMGAADEIVPTTAYKFVQGVSAFTAALSALQEAQKTNSCELARLGKDMFAIVNRTIPQAGSVDAATAGQIMTQTQEYAPYADQMVTAFCK